MNTLLLSQFFSTTRGGGEYVFSLVAKKLAEKGHKVWIITNKIIDEDYRNIDSIKIVFIPPTLEYKGGLPPSFFDNITYSINAVITGIKIIKNEKIDIIHSNNFAPALAGSILSSLTGKPHITTVHDVFSLCGKNYWKLWGSQSNVSRLNILLAPFFEKTIIKLKHNAIHTVSEATRDDLVKLGAKKPIYVIPNTIEIKKTENLESIPFQFIYIGRLVFYKNLDVVIKAIKIVKKTHPNIMLIIAGGGPYRENLESLVKQLNLQENIRFVGFVSADEKRILLAKSQALVFPSLCEGFGLVILEAFAQNKPVLVSAVRPMSDMVLHEKNGYVLNPYDERDWAEHLLKIMKNPQEASIMGQNGNHLLISSFNQELMYEKLIEMYSQCKKS